MFDNQEPIVLDLGLEQEPATDLFIAFSSFTYYEFIE